MHSVEGINFTLISVDVNKVFSCKKDCFRRRNCDIKPRFMLSKLSTSSIHATEAILEMTNTTEHPWSTSHHEWFMIDTASCLWESQQFCEDVTTSRYFSLYYSITIPPHATARVHLYFPEITEDVSSVVYQTKHATCEIIINPLSPEAYDLTHIRLSRISKNNDRYSLIGRAILQLEELYARRMVSFTSETIENSESDIAAMKAHIKGLIDNLPDDLKEVAVEWFDEVIRAGDIKIDFVRDVLHMRDMEQTSSLFTLTPREFEEWVADLFKVLGYDTELTPYVGDGGIDVWAKKGDKLSAIQCKRYNGLVQDSEIRGFHNAVSRYDNVDEMIFITTGLYTTSTKVFAQKQGIILFDRFNLWDMVKTAMLE